ncbi:hypothetical protein YC2023_072179 [Brassica napus]
MAKESIRISRILVMVLNRDLIVYSLSRKSRIAVNWSCDMDQGHEDTMMGSHPGGRVTACSVGCSILEYLMEMMVTSRWETFTLGREGTALASGSFIILAVVLIYFMYKAVGLRYLDLFRELQTRSGVSQSGAFVFHSQR